MRVSSTMSLGMGLSSGASDGNLLDSDDEGGDLGKPPLLRGFSDIVSNQTPMDMRGGGDLQPPGITRMRTQDWLAELGASSACLHACCARAHDRGSHPCLLFWPCVHQAPTWTRLQLWACRRRRCTLTRSVCTTSLRRLSRWVRLAT